MMDGHAFAAVDLGAESGRISLGRFDGTRVEVTVLSRFANVPVRVNGSLHWDILRIFRDVESGIGRVASESSASLEGIGIDSWAVDFGLLGRDKILIGNPHTYRDSRTDNMVELACRRLPREHIYRCTGIQLLKINTLYQLLAMEGSPQLEIAEHLLLIPDLLRFWLTGEMASEFTNATTTQLFDVENQTWAWDLLNTLGIPAHIFEKVVLPGTTQAPLLRGVAEEAGLSASVPVIAVTSHDTASAVVAVPAQDDSFAYISSGTWSLVGVELPEPILTAAALESNFTNEGGFEGRTRFLKNVMGLWLLQECRRVWAEADGLPFSYEDLERRAQAAPALTCVVDPDEPDFLPPGDMPARIRRFCVETTQPAPDAPGLVVRCIIDSLALKYRWAIDRAREISGRRIDVIHMVGGGSHNTLLCQATADATGRRIVAGPVEASAIGNVMVQAYFQGQVASLADIRSVVRRSTQTKTYEPSDNRNQWDTAYARLLEIMTMRGQAAAPHAPRVGI